MTHQLILLGAGVCIGVMGVMIYLWVRASIRRGDRPISDLEYSEFMDYMEKYHQKSKKYKRK